MDMKSPLTGGRVKEVCTTEVKEFRKERFLVHVRYYVCEDTGEQFTTTRQDTLQFNDLYAQYRIRHGIPFPDEIKAIRNRYNLKYSQISRLLGFGVNQYAKYESGEVPSGSNGKMIAAIRDKNVLLKLLADCKESFQLGEYEKIRSAILLSNEYEDDHASLRQIIYPEDGRSLLNGYGGMYVSRLFDMVRYIVKLHGEVFPTKLNKLMFYADFHHYRMASQSISGLRYRAMNFGPVPDHYATIYDNIPDLDKRLVEAHGMVGMLISCPSEVEKNNLSESQKESIEYVVKKLKPLDVSEIIKRSHEEPAWNRYFPTRAWIPYDEAFDLQLI